MASGIGFTDEQLSALVDVSQTLAHTPSDREMLQQVLMIVAKAMGAEVCSLRLLDETRHELYLAASYGLNAYSPPVQIGQSVVGRAVAECRAFPIPNIHDSPYQKSTFAAKRGLKSLISMPLMLRDKPIGGLTIYFRKRRAFAQTDVLFLQAVAAQAAVAVENALALRDTVGSLVCLVRAVEARDPYTQGHSHRVTLYAVRLAEAVGLDPDEIALIKLIGPVHDIGKIGVSDIIIKKPEALTPDEQRIIQRHTIIGENIIQPVRALRGGSYIVRMHHERLDGSGYPDGLAGEEIPTAVRVLTVADAYDAMTSLRPYRPPMEHEQAVEELFANRFAQFDPELVDAFRNLVVED